MSTFNAAYIPTQIGWRITGKCDYALCRFCYAPEENLDTDESTSRKIAEQIIKKADDYFAFSGKHLRVIVSGGEPLAEQFTIPVIKMLTDSGIKVTLSTNGYLLLNVFPDYNYHIDIIALPLEGIKIRDEEIRGQGHYDSVISALQHASSNHVKIKIETVVLPDTTAEDLDHIKTLCMRFQVRSWKLFAFNYYDNRNKYCSSTAIQFTRENNIIMDWLSKNSEPWIVYETIENRNGRHFIINPDGDITIPIMDTNTNIFTDSILANALVNFDEGIEKWWRICNLPEVIRHYDLMNAPVHGLYSDKTLVEDLKYV